MWAGCQLSENHNEKDALGLLILFMNPNFENFYLQHMPSPWTAQQAPAIFLNTFPADISKKPPKYQNSTGFQPAPFHCAARPSIRTKKPLAKSATASNP